MAEYIDREVAMGALKTLQKELQRDFPLSEKDPEDASFNYGLWQGVTWAIRGIKEVHPADVKPVVHGKWHDCYELIDGTFVGTCSACGKIKKSLYPVMDNYCSECGAIMDADMRGNAND